MKKMKMCDVAISLRNKENGNEENAVLLEKSF